MACTPIMKKARTSCDYGWIDPNTGMPHTRQHAHSFATCFQHGALFQQLAPFLVPLTSFMLITTNWLMQDMVSRSTAPLRLSLAVRQMDRKWGDFNSCMAPYPLAFLARYHFVMSRASRTPSRVTRHTVFVWRCISFFANGIQPVETFKLKLQPWHTCSQQPWHPAAGVLWSDKRLIRREAISLFFAS
jgi:hypothetical protein